MNNGIKPTYIFLVAASLVLLNFLLTAFYILWLNIDNWALNRSELHGFEPSQLLPGGDVMWLVANGTIFALILFDILFIYFFVQTKKVIRINHS